jgi:hypothetical protein
VIAAERALIAASWNFRDGAPETAPGRSLTGAGEWQIDRIPRFP